MLSQSITFDLLITIPIIHYFQIRKTNRSKYSVLTTFSLCLLVATFLIPDDHQQKINIIKKLVLPLAKLIVLFVIFSKLRELFLNYKAIEKSGLRYHRIKTALISTFTGKLGKLLAMECGVVYFFFKKKSATSYVDNRFGYTSNKGTLEMVMGFMFIIIIETVVTHILIHKWSPLVAYLCSYSSLYLIVLFISNLKSRHYNPKSLFEIATHGIPTRILILTY